MSRIRLYTDEDVYGSVAAKLRESGLDALSTPEAKRLGTSDRLQLEWATSEGRVLLTFNVAHFVELHGKGLTPSRPHAGILVSKQRPIGDLLRRVLALSKVLGMDEMHGRLEYLSNG
jgi:hypothetical protein